MFDDLKKLKDKSRNLTEKPEGLDFSLPENIEVEKLLDDTKSTLEEGAEATADGARRAAGKVKGTFTPPKSETTRGFLKEETHFFCSNCNAKLGPLETKKWKNALKALMGGAATVAGVVLVNPVLVFKGATSLTSLKKDDRGMIDKLRGDSKLKENARNFLVQCEYCGNWVCSKCYMAEKIICNKCGEQRGLVEELMSTGSELISKQDGERADKQTE